jgi:hypothetical protein
VADISTAVRQYLIANSGVSALIGTRIYTHLLKQDATLPAVVMNKISTQHHHTLSNFSGNASVRLQFDCYGATADSANDVAEAIRTSGIVGLKGVTNSVDIRGARMEEGERYEVDPARDGSDEHRYITSFDLMVDYTETI